jgi:hypothetical protein
MNSFQDQFNPRGANIIQVVQQNVQSAQDEIAQIKKKGSSYGNSATNELDLPNFKPNLGKSKSFTKKLEYGTNFQTTHSNFFYPTTTDISLSLGYKVSGDNVIGIGGGYKIGLGKDIQHMQFSSEGASVRSFLDIKIKKSFFASGGFEYNYQKPFNTSNIFYHYDLWQQSGLVGISKIISFKTKVIKKTKIQLLWDFLSYQQIPKAQPLKFRIGYTF